MERKELLGKVKEMIRKNVCNPRRLFVMVIFLSYAFVLFHDFTRIGLGRSNNIFLPTNETGYTYIDIDTGMDFFNSMQYVKKKVPYTELGTVYPPLANLFFYFLYKFLPTEVTWLIPETFDDILYARATYADMRVHQAPMLLFLFCVVAVLFGLYKEFKRILKGKCDEVAQETLAIALCSSIGVIYAIERGNIIILSFLLLLYFVRNYNSDNKIRKEFALVSLAASAGLKLYPALFGILLLKDRKYKEAIRTVIYGVAAFVLPFFFFEGFDAIKVYFSILTGFSQSSDFKLGSYGIQGNFKTILYFYRYIKSAITNTPLPGYEAYEGLVNASQKISYLVGIVLLVFVLFEKSNWRRYLYIVVAMLSVQLSGQYTSIYLIIPFVYLIADRRKFTKDNVWEYVFMMIMMLPVPLQIFKIPFPHNTQYTMVKLTYQIGYTLLLIISFIRGIQAVRLNGREVKDNFSKMISRK